MLRIERLSIPEGISVNSSTEVFLEASIRLKDFQPVTSDTTVRPDLLKRFNYSRELKISSDGQSAQLSRNSGKKATQYDAVNVKLRKDGSFRLMHEGDAYVITGPGKRRGEVRMYDYFRVVRVRGRTSTTRRAK